MASGVARDLAGGSLLRPKFEAKGGGSSGPPFHQRGLGEVLQSPSGVRAEQIISDA